jgi:hypothetical protein
MSQYKSFPPKHPTSKLDYVFDWAPLKNDTGLSNWLREGETISSYTIDVPEGIDKISDELVNDNTSVLVWLDNGTVDEDYLIQCNIVTNQGREDTRTVILPIKNR